MSALQKFKTFFSKNVLLCLTVPMVVFSLLVPQPFVWMGQNISIDLSGIPFLKENFPSFGFVNMLLCVIMFGMGMTLKADDFKYIFKKPTDVLIGICSQYVFMAGFGWLVASLLSLTGVGDPTVRAQIAVGLVLLGCVPGGTASNVMTFLAKGDVALSITITMCTTLLAPVLTPSLTLVLAGQWIDVNFWNMFISIVLVVLLPILLGIAVHTALGDRVNGLKDFLVKASTACIILVEGLCVGPNRDQFTTHGVTVVLVTVLAVALHHVLGLLAGYVTAKVFRFNEKKVRTLSLEVGLQNSGLSCTLAKTAFPDTMAILPCVIATVVHQIIGPIVATVSFIGELLHYLIPLPVPSSIYGLLLMLLLLVTHIVKLDHVKTTADWLITLMPVMFVGPTVGLIASYDSYKDILIPIIVISLATTVLTMAVSGLTTQGLIRLQTKEEKEERAEALEACEKEEQTDVK